MISPSRFRMYERRRLGARPLVRARALPITPSRQLQLPEASFERRTVPDFVAEPADIAAVEQARRKLDSLPLPKAGRLGLTPSWNSVALFFNLDLPTTALPRGYASTTAQHALDWLDEGSAPLRPSVSEFMVQYWSTLSGGRLSFGLTTPRDAANVPLVPLVRPDGQNPHDWLGLIIKCIAANPEAVWKAAGGLWSGEKRWIPSVVLVQNYGAHASAAFGGFDLELGGHTYAIGDYTHVEYNLATWAPPEAPSRVGREVWGTLCHEYGHNFLQYWDLYGPQGCTGYWDLLGSNSPPGRMSEVCSTLKERVGWLEFREVIKGPTVAPRALTLKPYTTSAEAYKIVPDPDHTPWEYFTLEYRVSTGDEVWRPDGALSEGGLLILHMNDRLGVASTWLLREAPFFDPEFADETRLGWVQWLGHNALRGKLFPQGSKDSFDHGTIPSSRMYGGRKSGLSITNIRVEGGLLKFNLQLDGWHRVGWTLGAADRAVAGRFTEDAPTGGEQLLIRNEHQAALLVHREAQWLVAGTHDEWIGNWRLAAADRALVADFDRDGLDEILVRSPGRAGLLKWRVAAFDTISLQNDSIDGWSLGAGDWEHAADLDGDGRPEVYVRSPNAAGVLAFDGTRFVLTFQASPRLGGWALGPDDTELVGRFSGPGRDEILIRSPESLGLLRWSNTRRQLESLSIQSDRIDSWDLSAADVQAVGDFDGDGLDEIFVCSGGSAALLKWDGARFAVRWMTSGGLAIHGGDPAALVPLPSGVRLYAGRFRMDRDGVLLRGANELSLVIWVAGAMKVHSRYSGTIDGRWSLGPDDQLVLGDFHRLGHDVADPLDYEIDGLTDVFIHNATASGMLGVNHGAPNASQPWSLVDQVGLTWYQGHELLWL